MDNVYILIAKDDTIIDCVVADTVIAALDKLIANHNGTGTWCHIAENDGYADLCNEIILNGKRLDVVSVTGGITIIGNSDDGVVL